MVRSKFGLWLIAPLVVWAAEPCQDAEDVESCRSAVHDLVGKFDEEEKALCGAIDQFHPEAHMLAGVLMTSCSNEGWQPCGGKTYPNAPTCCPSGFTCYNQNEYYSQCRNDGCPAGWDCSSNPTCFSARSENECYKHIVWARDHGRYEHPEWYGPMPHYVKNFNDLNGARNDDFQMYFYCNPYFAGMPHNCGAPVCGRECENHTAEHEQIMNEIEGANDDKAEELGDDAASQYCNSDQVDAEIKWNGNEGKFDCDEVRKTCANEGGDENCDDVAKDFCVDNQAVPYKKNELCADPGELQRDGYDNAVVRGGGRRLMRWRWRWWRIGRWFLCHAAYGFAIILFGGFGLRTAARCDIIMTRFVIRCLVYFGISPFSAVCLAGWMSALTYACQAVVAATVLAIQGFFMYFIRCGKKPSFRRLMELSDPSNLFLDDPTNGKRLALGYNDVPLLPEINVPAVWSHRRRLENGFQELRDMREAQDTYRSDTCGCLTGISEDHFNALSSIIGDGLSSMRSDCASTRTDCASITNRGKCMEADGCRFDKVKKACTAFVASACNFFTHKWQCRAQESCRWFEQTCVEASPADDRAKCPGYSRKQCKRDNTGVCRWVRKSKECVATQAD